MPIARQGPSVLAKIASGGGADFTVPGAWAQTAYGSGWPVQPVSAPQDVQLPRTVDYPISVNATLTPRTGYGLMPFSALLEAYENVTECKMPVSLIHRELTSFKPHLIDEDGNEVNDHDYQWMCEFPDRKTPFGVWLTRFLKSSKVYDAPAVYLQGEPGKTEALHYIDGSTLFIIVDQYGNVPEPERVDEYAARIAAEEATGSSSPTISGTTPAYTDLDSFIRAYSSREKARQSVPDKMPAYAQIIKGTPFSWWSADQIRYMPQSRRMNSPYGESFIEQAWSWIMIVVNLTAFELGHYKTGNMPEGFITVPRDLFSNTDQVMAAELMYNARMSSNPATERMRVRVFPDGTKYFPTKKPDFPERLYRQAWNNILHTIGIPPSEFGEIPGGGLGGKGFKEGAATDLGRNTLNPHRDFVSGLFNGVLQRDGVQDVKFELAYPMDEIDPDKQKMSVYEGMARGTLSLNDALGQLNLQPVGDPDDKNNIANKHLIVAGAAIYVVEDMQTQNGMAVPTYTGKPGGNTGGTPVGPETAAEQQGATHSPEDLKTLQSLIRHMQESGTLDGKTISVPSGKKFVKEAPPVTIAIPEVFFDFTPGPPDHTPIDPRPIMTGIDERRHNETPIIPVSPGDNARPIGVSHMAEWIRRAMAQERKAHPDWTYDQLTALIQENIRQKYDYYGYRDLAEVAGRDDPMLYPGIAFGPLPDLSKADATHTDGAMVAVMIPLEAAKKLRTITEGLGLPDTANLELPENMHVTLAFLPDAAGARDRFDAMVRRLNELAKGTPELRGKIQGYGVFNGKDGTKVLFALLDEPQLPFLRTNVCNALHDCGVSYGKDYGFVPHITMAYFPESFELPAGFAVPDIPAEIGEITVAFGTELTAIPLGKSVSKVIQADGLQKHCGVCPEDDDYFGAPISREVLLDFPNGNHANGVELVAMCPEGLPAKAALWKPEGGEKTALQDWIGGVMYPREEAAYLLDRSLGFMLVPVAYVAEANDEIGAAVYYTPGAGPGGPMEQYAPEWVERAAVLDYISNQHDRHYPNHNYLTHPDDPTRPVLIDNGLSFPVDPQGGCDSPFCQAWLGKPLSNEVLTAIRLCLGDASTWKDILALVGPEAVQKARACAQFLLEQKMLIAAETSVDTRGSGGL
jgi:2'-5' RNA ligase